MCRQRTLLYYCGCETALDNLERCEEPHESCFSYAIQPRREPCPESLESLQQGLPLTCKSMSTMTGQQKQALREYVRRCRRSSMPEDNAWESWEQTWLACLFEISDPEKSEEASELLDDQEPEIKFEQLPIPGSRVSLAVRDGSGKLWSGVWSLLRMMWVLIVVVAWVWALDAAYLAAFELLEELQHIKGYYARRGWANGQLSWREMRLSGLLIRRMLLVCRWLLLSGA